MGGAGGRRPVWAWTASVLAHAGLAVALLWASRDLPRHRSVEPPIELAIEVAGPIDAGARAALPRARSRSVTTPAAPAASAPAMRHHVARPMRGAGSRSVPSTQAATEAVAAPSGCPTPTSPRVSLDPRSVALRALLDDSPGVDQGTASGGERSRSSELDDSLRAFADRGRAELSTRPPPVLRPTPDGGYVYEPAGSTPLRARIAPDGRLSFEVHGSVDPEPGVATDPATGRAWPTIQFRPNLDLNDAVAAIAGEDPLAPEKAWIARETEGLRERLAARARAVEVEAALEGLRRRLEDLAADVGAARRRELVFEIWDDCATDAIGDRARRIVEAFIRERFPEGTALAYTPVELQRLNDRRLTAARFDPYARDRDAG